MGRGNSKGRGLTSQGSLVCGMDRKGQDDRSRAERHGGVDNWKVVGWQAVQILVKVVSNALNQFWVLMNSVQRS